MLLDARPRPGLLTGHRSAWWVLLVALVLSVAALGGLRGVEAPPRADAMPASSESGVVAEQLTHFPGYDVQPVLLVADRGGEELGESDLTALGQLGAELSALTGHDASPPMPADDGLAAIVALPITVGADNTETATTIGDLRAAIDAHAADGGLDGLTVHVTGGPAFGADVASAFDGADLTLLLVTVGIVALLLLLTYRSPVLWLVPLAVVGVADGVAGAVTGWVGATFGLSFDAGIISVLVFGAGTNYALLLISRYREELTVEEDHRLALRRAWRATVPAIVASNLTVGLAVLTLALAVLPRTRGLGVTSAAGLLVALAFVLLVLPPALAVSRRRIFWPFVPRPARHTAPSARGTTDDTPTATHAGGTAYPRRTNTWGRIARRVVDAPVRVLLAGAVLLGVMAAGLAGMSVGLSQLDQFRVKSESATGLEVLAEHWPAGEAQPMTVTTWTDSAERVADEVGDVEGVTRVSLGGDDGAGLARLTVVGEHAPGTPQALALVEEVRDVAHAIPGADALVGGGPAEELDARAASERDLLVVAPLVLAASLLVLVVLLRAVVAPVLLLVVNAVSAVAALGAGAFLSRQLLGLPALDHQVPLLAFLFLVALGIDYTIFLVHRARHEAQAHGTREGMVRAVAGTGAVITSAGIVLAAVFAALGVLPLVTLRQLGLVVGVGVVVDTLVVRTLLVPALFALLGDRAWWPGRAPGTPQWTA